MNLSDAPKTHWSDLFGNKYSKSLDPAMLSEDGLVRSQRCRTLDDDVTDIRLVIYDRQYVLKYLEMKLVKPLFVCGNKALIELINEAFLQYSNPKAFAERKGVGKKIW